MRKYYFVIVGVLVLFFALGIGKTSAQATYKDVNNKFWAYDQINHLSENRIIGGYPDGTFKPNNQLTRGQAAKMLVKALKLSTDHRPTPGISPFNLP